MDGVVGGAGVGGAGLERGTALARVRRAALGVILLALLPSVGTLAAPWIAEDASILAQVHADGPWADWGRGQYGMQLLRFWRPLVSTSWALQEAVSGIDPLPLRSFNLGLHALVALAVFGLALRLGVGLRGAFLAGAWSALFPAQGGTVTWLAGRTDLLCAVFLVGSAWAALGPRPMLGAPLAFLACASKEFGFLAPLWCFLLALAGGADGRLALRRTWPAALGAGVAFVWRWLALDGATGGYPALLPGPVAGAGAALAASAQSAWPSLVALAVLALAGAWAQSLRARPLALVLVLALASLAPLYPLLADGFLEVENRRLLFVAECALALAAGLAVGRPARGPASARVLVALACVALGARLGSAWSDTHAWARSARFGEQAIARARAALVAAEPGPGPVLFGDFEAGHGGAYCLGFGLAARFRAPFPATARPVWPWRLAFVAGPERARAALVEARADGSLWPLDDARRVPELVLSDANGAGLERLELDERALLAREDRSPRVRIAGGPGGASLEVVLFTELGYEPFELGPLDGAGAGSFSLMQLLVSSNGVCALAELLAQAADLGATRAYLELRARAAEGEVRAASRWIELVWPPGLRERALSSR